MLRAMAGEACSIAIVDDDAAMGQAIERLLMASGWKARTFLSAEDFLRSPFLPEISLLLLDIQLPGMSGPELHQRLRADGTNVSVIYITGHDHPHLRDRALGIGAKAYFTKPFTGQLLIDAVARHFSLP